MRGAIKRLSSTLLALAMLVTLIPMSAFADSTDTGGNQDTSILGDIESVAEVSLDFQNAESQSSEETADEADEETAAVANVPDTVEEPLKGKEDLGGGGNNGTKEVSVPPKEFALPDKADADKAEKDIAILLADSLTYEGVSHFHRTIANIF